MIKILTSPLFFSYYFVDIVAMIYRFITMGRSDEKYYEQTLEATAPIWILQIVIANFIGTFDAVAGIYKAIAEIVFVILAIPFTWAIVGIVLVGSVPNIRSKMDEDK